MRALWAPGCRKWRNCLLELSASQSCHPPVSQYRHSKPQHSAIFDFKEFFASRILNIGRPPAEWPAKIILPASALAGRSLLSFSFVKDSSIRKSNLPLALRLPYVAALPSPNFCTKVGAIRIASVWLASSSSRRHLKNGVPQ